MFSAIPNSKKLNNKLEEKLILDPDSRFELKYRLSYYQYLRVKNAIVPYMAKDPYTAKKPSNRYLVRSLYFDTYDYHAYDQKMSGDCDRVKFRMRTYTKIYDEVRTVRIEMKIREGNRAVKKSVFAPVLEYEHFMSKRHWESFDHPITNEFERRLLTRNLLPQVLVEYQREGYQTRLKSNLRITFDHAVRSAHGKTLFPNHAFFRYLYPKYVVLEIKFKDSLPVWLEGLVKAHGLKVIANSKFTQSIQLGRPDLHHPGNVIFIR